MLVKNLIDFLVKLNPEAEVVVHRDADNWGFGLIDKIDIGIFEENDTGNEFHPDESLVVNPNEVLAVCIYAEDNEIIEDNAKKLNG